LFSSLVYFMILFLTHVKNWGRVLTCVMFGSSLSHRRGHPFVKSTFDVSKKTGHADLLSASVSATRSLCNSLCGSTIIHGSHTHQSVRNAKSTRGYVLMLARMATRGDVLMLVRVGEV
jgi:hypothetical protein